MTRLERAHLLEEPGVYLLVSTSTVQYWLDSRGRPARMYRANSNGPVDRDPFDDMWVTVLECRSGPTLVRDGRVLRPDEVDETDVQEWVVRVGSRPQLWCEGVNQFGQVEQYPWTARVTEAIDRFDAPPDERDMHLTAEDLVERYGVTPW